MVRKLVGYGRLSGLHAAATLGRLYQSARLYVNFFQPSFKLKSKQRDGALVRKHYHPPLTPCQRLLASPAVDEVVKEQLRQQFATLDPVTLLKTMREINLHRDRLFALVYFIKSIRPLVQLRDQCRRVHSACA